MWTLLILSEAFGCVVCTKALIKQLYVIVRKQSDSLRHQVDSSPGHTQAGPIVPIILPDSMLARIPGECVDELHLQVYAYFKKYEQQLEEEFCAPYQRAHAIGPVDTPAGVPGWVEKDAGVGMQTPGVVPGSLSQADTVVEKYCPPALAATTEKAQTQTPSHRPVYAHLVTPAAVSDHELMAFHHSRAARQVGGLGSAVAITPRPGPAPEVAAVIPSYGTRVVPEGAAAREFLSGYVRKHSPGAGRRNGSTGAGRTYPESEGYGALEDAGERGSESSPGKVQTSPGRPRTSTPDGARLSRDFLSPISKLTPGGDITAPSTPYTAPQLSGPRSPAVILA